MALCATPAGVTLVAHSFDAVGSIMANRLHSILKSVVSAICSTRLPLVASILGFATAVGDPTSITARPVGLELQRNGLHQGRDHQ